MTGEPSFSGHMDNAASLLNAQGSWRKMGWTRTYLWGSVSETWQGSCTLGIVTKNGCVNKTWKVAVPVNMLSCTGEIPQGSTSIEELNTGYQWLWEEEESVSCEEGECRLSNHKWSALNTVFTHTYEQFQMDSADCVDTRVYGRMVDVTISGVHGFEMGEWGIVKIKKNSKEKTLFINWSFYKGNQRINIMQEI